MKPFIAAVSLVLLTGCAQTVQVTPQRIADDAGCVLALAGQGAAIASGMGAAQAITLISQAGQQNPAVFTACAALLSHLQEDINAAKAAPAAPVAK